MTGLAYGWSRFFVPAIRANRQRGRSVGTCVKRRSIAKANGEDTLASELIEIDENLCRAELTSAQRSSTIKRRREIWAAMHPDSGTSGSTIAAGPGRPQEFASETSASAGMTKQAINRHLARAEALGDDVDAVVGTSLDKGVEMGRQTSHP